MKTYSNKTVRVNPQVCLYEEINAGDKARKKAERFKSKKEVQTEVLSELNNVWIEVLQVFNW